MVYSGRKDMVQISQWTDLNATLENFQCSKGTHKYKKDKQLANELKAVIAGSVTAGDRLEAMGIVESDKCPHCGSDEVRHTTLHMFWECKHTHRIGIGPKLIEKSQHLVGQGAGTACLG